MKRGTQPENSTLQTGQQEMMSFEKIFFPEKVLMHFSEVYPHGPGHTYIIWTKEMLSEEGFIRVHQSHLINLAYAVFNGVATVSMSDGSSVPLARRKRKILVDMMEKRQ